MIICRKDIIKTILIIIIGILLIVSFKIIKYNFSMYKIGAEIHKQQDKEENYTKTVFNNNEDDFYEGRFQRPSKDPGVKLKYKFDVSKEYPKKYSSSQGIIEAYYSILKDASNMMNFQGGCGTIGDAKAPYPYAYELLSEDTKKHISLEEFEKSFEGIGHITLLKYLPAYSPPNTPKNIKYYFAEIEVITGAPESEDKNKPSYFAYYYGIITTEHNETGGWKIKSIDYFPEDFLCAPWHQWDWESKMLAQIIYGDWYKLIDKIDKVKKQGEYISVYASGKDKSYRFDFVRLTNGEDILLHEYVREDDKWKEVNILKPEHLMYKLSILRFKN